MSVSIAKEQTTAESPIDRLRRLVTARVVQLQRAYRANEAGAVSELARMRRGIGRGIGWNADLVGLTVAPFYDEIPDGKFIPTEPTDEERAAYAALTLFAAHQQSQRSGSAHRAGYSFGRSARMLRAAKKSDQGVVRRFEALATASTFEGLEYNARGLIQQFRQEQIPLDYGQFAVDLYLLQRPETAKLVRRRWGIDFYRLGTGSASEPAEQPEPHSHHDNPDLNPGNEDH
ncbi:type I-E CRISPR-associated protein Cse2/CasB [Psychromicrobium xiongbiense]|uniref:type I-E CRISPR-associated protein Cse2/CasB n=1 Tax=Psychromicrobium xiongbiense TaxID=3051184 RepID=UPI00255635B4|nr:type I-E CRISPR-associated protein Cse2/CasB [Psychromicrobium sp. YIM S02556]